MTVGVVGSSRWRGGYGRECWADAVRRAPPDPGSVPDAADHGAQLRHHAAGTWWAGPVRRGSSHRPGVSGDHAGVVRPDRAGLGPIRQVAGKRGAPRLWLLVHRPTTGAREDRRADPGQLPALDRSV